MHLEALHRISDGTLLSEHRPVPQYSESEMECGIFYKHSAQRP